MTQPASTGRHRIVVIGGGAAGLELACRLGRSVGRRQADIILVDRSPAHFWKPRLHELAAGVGEGETTAFLSLAHAHGFRFCLGELAGWSRAERTVTIAEVEGRASKVAVLGRRSLPYDTLVFALGSRVNDFGIPGVSQYCHMLDGTQEALALRLGLLEAAVRAGAEAQVGVKVGIVGAGATGVELAAELHHAARMLDCYEAFGQAANLSITIIDQARRVLPAVDARTSANAHKSLERKGIKLILGQGVRAVAESGLHLTNGDVLPCDIMVWASGITGQPVAAELGLPLTKTNRIITDANLACQGTSDVFAIGDCAAVPTEDGKGTVPPTAQAAHQQAIYLARALEKRIQGLSCSGFQYRPRGSLVSLGAYEAAADFAAPPGVARALPAHGVIAKFLYVVLFHAHRATLHGWARAAALFVSDGLRHSLFPAVKLH